MSVLRGLRTVVLAPVFVVGTLVASAIVFALAATNRGEAADRAVRSWSRFFLSLAAAELTTDGAEQIDRSGQYVFIANHLSNLDIPVMFLATEMPIRYLAKAELFKIPILKQAMDALGIVRVDRIAGAAIHYEVNEGVAAARDHGDSLIIFPEGTRSLSGEMAGFKKGAFRIAITNELDIIPVTIVGTWEAWRPHSKVVRGGPVHAFIHEPISVQGLTLADMDELRDRVHTVIRKEYETQRAILSASR
ncbi:MAG: 1-acyl-sn-glycerol-3-phosphate acyltransferase [Acidimicrobiia bacterium]|nr:1-acyl-sn-glycerol-3-phosphate acyltransferase [Acidimicrobiia bacterium]